MQGRVDVGREEEEGPGSGALGSQVQGKRSGSERHNLREWLSPERGKPAKKGRIR